MLKIFEQRSRFKTHFFNQLLMDSLLKKLDRLKMECKSSQLVCTLVVGFLVLFQSCQLLDYEEVETDFSPSESSGLSVMRINTDGRIIRSTEHWLEHASYQVFDTSGVLLHNGTLDIKGRGNTTWKLPKKPYSLRFSENTALVGMPTHKRWNLLANFTDKTLLRTEVAFQLGYIFDHLSWTPHSTQLDLYLNGSYRGVYQLTEAICIDENRVDIDTISASNPQNGYILEVNWRKGERYNFTTRMGIVFCCTDPDVDLDDKISGDTLSLFQKISMDVQHVEDVIYSVNFKDTMEGYRKYLDIPSFIDWYFVNELTKNVDAQFGLSVYLYYNNVKKKYCMGPIWDFDYAIGNVNYAESRLPTGFWVKNSYWVARLFEDPAFVAAVKARWLVKRAETMDIVSFILDRADRLGKAQSFNFKKWNVLDKQIASGASIVGDYQFQIDVMSKWLTERFDWFDSEIAKL